MSSRAVAAACALCLGLAAGGATGQQATGSILGRVVDEEGAVLPGAVVRVFAMTTGWTHTAVTDADGSFRFPELPPGPYHVSAELEGFAIREAEVDLRFATAASIELRLTVQSIKETITVTSSGSTRLSTPTWNSWLEVRGAGGEPVERLERGGRYEFRVDLAPLAYRLAGKGIRVNAVSPGNVYFEGGIWAWIEKNNPDLFKQALALNPTGRMATMTRVPSGWPGAGTRPNGVSASPARTVAAISPRGEKKRAAVRSTGDW